MAQVFQSSAAPAEYLDFAPTQRCLPPHLLQQRLSTRDFLVGPLSRAALVYLSHFQDLFRPDLSRG